MEIEDEHDKARGWGTGWAKPLKADCQVGPRILAFLFGYTYIIFYIINKKNSPKNFKNTSLFVQFQLHLFY